MKMSQYFSFTMKETPKEAEVTSHSLMMRAGMISKLTSGVYTFMPLGLRVLRKIENIIREELDGIGAHELLMPILQPKELWEESGRWDKMGELMFKLQDRGKREYCLGPTHEEVITDLFKKIVKSYKNLPVSLYQIQLKFRDEIRPRFGVMRSREFLMKDAYSFHLTEECLSQTYEKFYQAYSNIFSRCGLRFRAVEADSGDIGGSVSHEFMVLAETGEDSIIYCEKCSYASNIESAKAAFPPRIKSELKEFGEIHTPDVKTIEELTKFFGIHSSNFIKSILYKDENNNFYLVYIRGDLEVNEVKLKHYVKGNNIMLADDNDIKNIFGCSSGFLGITSNQKSLNVMADLSLENEKEMITGAGKNDYHYAGTDSEKLGAVHYYDLSLTDSRFKCSKCDGDLKIERGIEVGHIFQLGDKYTQNSNTKVVTEDNSEKCVLMGCYGIGVSRIIAAAIEQNFDSKGILWSESLTPFFINVIPVDINKVELSSKAEELYNEFKKQGYEVVYDDRPQRAGFKFKDSDLMGIPFKVIIGKAYSENNLIQVEDRDGKKLEMTENDMFEFFNKKKV